MTEFQTEWTHRQTWSLAKHPYNEWINIQLVTSSFYLQNKEDGHDLMVK